MKKISDAEKEKKKENILICSRENNRERKICYEWKSHYFFTLILTYHPLTHSSHCCRMEMENRYEKGLLSLHPLAHFLSLIATVMNENLYFQPNHLRSSAICLVRWISAVIVAIWNRNLNFLPKCFWSLMFYRKSIPEGRKAHSSTQIDLPSSLFSLRNVFHPWSHCSHHHRLKIIRKNSLNFLYVTSFMKIISPHSQSCLMQI